VIHSSALSGSRKNVGFTLIELLVSIAIGTLLIIGMATVMSMISGTMSTSHYNHQLTREAQFAMNQMVRAVANSERLMLPLADNPDTNWPEHIREQTVPASAPVGDSTLATAVLAITLDAYIDLDADGIADADNDADGLIDEDLGSDQTADNAAGIVLIDDDGDGEVDDVLSAIQDDDEDGAQDEDWLNGIDDDGDGTVDEDSSADTNNDGDDGIDGVDDDDDGQVDEGSGSSNDDEDNQTDEDFYDAVVFYLDNGTLVQRIPVPWDENTDSTVNGLDFVSTPLAENITLFRVERITPGAGAVRLVDLTLVISHPQTAETVRLHTRVRVGKAL